MIRSVIFWAALLLLASCREKQASDKPTTDRPCPTMQLPTATEVFDLRTRCAALGAKMLEQNIIGSALTQEQVSHYNITTGHCYVKLDVHTADLNTPRDKFITSTYLYDGQTKDLLASTDVHGEKRTGMLFSDDLKKLSKDPVIASQDEVRDIIDKFMSEDRKP